MKLWIPFAAGAVSLLAVASIVGADWDLPPVDSKQVGYRGTGMVQVTDREDTASSREANMPPESPWEPDPEGDRAGDIYENVQVLGHLSDDQFNHFMASITEWVSPDEGCNYCHNPDNLASDEVYTKVVARRMIQMNQAINVDWQPHVGETGVSCYTCHRGQHIPANAWVMDDGQKAAGGMAGSRQGQNQASAVVGSSSLPYGALEDYLLGDREIRVHSATALPTDGEDTVGTKNAEATWGLMMHMSTSLNANCVTCHNSRAFNDWDQSPPQRVTAWHGIRMVREINNEYITGLTSVFPDNRKGPQGDVYKVSCATCHNGQQLPLNGMSMLGDYMDSIGQKTDETVPDYSTYQPGETEVLASPAAMEAAAEAEAEAEAMQSEEASGDTMDNMESESGEATDSGTMDSGDGADMQSDESDAAQDN